MDRFIKSRLQSAFYFTNKSPPNENSLICFIKKTD